MWGIVADGPDHKHGKAPEGLPELNKEVAQLQQKLDDARAKQNNLRQFTVTHG